MAVFRRRQHLAPLTGDRLGPAEITPASLAALLASPIYAELGKTFANWPPQSLMSDESRAILYCLIRMGRPQAVAEIGTQYAGTAEVLARALWENGGGELHTTDPFGKERCPKIIARWPRDLRRVTHFYPLTSMDFLLDLQKRRITLDLVLVDGNHDYEFALFDLQMSAQLLRPGGVVVMDNAEQTGPFEASRAFLERNPAWRELGNAIAAYDPNAPFDTTRSSVPYTTFILLQSPRHISIGPTVHSSGQPWTTLKSVSGFTLDLLPQTTAGTLHYHAIFRLFADANRDVREFKVTGSLPIKASGDQTIVTHRFAAPLGAAAPPADALFTFETNLLWRAERGSPPLALASAPKPLDGAV